MQPPADADPGVPLSLRLFRVQAGQTCKVLFRSYSNQGCFTHWIGKTEWCDPKGCPPIWHKTRRLWYGYESCDLWDHPSGQWLPIVLEITSHAELDLRDLCKRGQIWTFTRPMPIPRGKRTKHFPVTATYNESREVSEVPHALDVLAVLAHNFSRPDILLGEANPLPPKQFAVPTVMAPPKGLQKEEEKSRNVLPLKTMKEREAERLAAERRQKE